MALDIPPGYRALKEADVAAYLADLIGLNGSAIWREARKLAKSQCDHVSRPAIAA